MAKELIRDDEKISDITEGGDIGDEQMPAGEIKTDKHAWDYEAKKVKENDLPRKIKEFLAGF